MDISINGKPADIVPDTEKTLGEMLSGLEEWLAGEGRRISGLRVNGETLGSSALDAAFSLDLKSVTTLDISTSSWPELAVEALADAREVLRAWEGASFPDRAEIGKNWRESPAARFLSAEAADIFPLVERALRGEGPGPAEVSALVDERFREIGDPRGEFALAENLVTTVAGRLEELPLDIQTGKDGRAAETVQLFSHTAEKIFRLLYFLKTEGLPLDSLVVGEQRIHDFIGEFSSALKELLAAYEVKDAVLVGDLAEYELAPRLCKLYGAVKDSAAAI
jgi:hypothetical protein